MQAAVHQKSIGQIILSIFFPFWSFILSLRDFRSSSAKAVYFVFCVWIGAVFIYNVSDTSLSSANVRTSDSSKIALQYITTHNTDVGFKEYFENRDMHDRFDFFQITSIYFLSRLSGNPRLWFLYIAVIFAFFHVNNTWYVLQRCKKPVNFIWGLLVALLIFTVPITEGLNATRMNLAIQIYLFGLLPFLIDGDKKKIWVSFLCLLVHFSMLLPVVIFIGFAFLPKKNVTPYLVLFFISYLIKTLDIGFINNALSYLPLGLDERFGLYTDDASLEANQTWREQSSLIYVLSRDARMYICLIVMLTLAISNKAQLSNSPWKNLLVFALLFYSIANVLASLPSGYRYLRISNILLISWILLTFNNLCTKQMKTALTIVSPILIYAVVWGVRMTFDYLGLETLWGNFITTIFVEDNNPLSKILGLSY